MMMFRHTHNVLLAVLAATTAVTFVHAGDGTTCLVTTICDPMEPQLADCTDEKGSQFQACCPPIILTGGDPAAGEGFTCVAFGAAPPTVVTEVPQAVAAVPVPAATPAVVAPIPAATTAVPAVAVATPAPVAAPVVATDPAVVSEPAVADSPTDDPTPGPTPDPTPGPTDDPTPGPTPDPTPGPTPGPTPDPTPGPGPTDDGPTEDWQPAVNEATQHAADVTAKYAPDGGDWEQTTSDALANSANDVKNAIQTGSDAVDAWNGESNLVDAPNTAESGSTGSRSTVLAAIATLATAAVAAALL